MEQLQSIETKIQKARKNKIHLKLKLSDADMQRTIKFLQLESGEGAEIVRPSDQLAFKHVSILLGAPDLIIQELVKLGSLTLTEDGQSITGESLIKLHKRTMEIEEQDDEDF